MSGEHVRRTWVQETTWRCSSCKTINKGRDLHCKECGSDKEEHETDAEVAPDLSAAVTDPDLLKKARSGPHWVCSFCQADQWSFERQCGKCGALREESAPRVRDTSSKASRVRDVSPTARKISPSAVVAALSDPVPDLRPRRQWIAFATATLAALAVTSLLVWIFVPHEVRAKVQQTTWKHVSTLRKRETRHGEGWGSPAGAFNNSCQRRFKEYEDCRPHNCRPHPESYACGSYDCNCRNSCTKSGNGFASCQEVCSTCSRYCTRTAYDTCYDRCEVFDDWCSYDYYAWPVAATQVAEGAGPSTSWPPLQAVGELQRLERAASYSVMFSAGQKSWTYSPKTLDEYRRFASGSDWDVKVNRAGQIWPQKPSN